MNSSVTKKVSNLNQCSTLSLMALVTGLACIGVGQTLLYTILGPIGREIGLTEIRVGSIVTIAALIITVASAYWGKLIHGLGSRFVFLAGMFFYAAGTFMLGLFLHISVEHIVSVNVAFILLIIVRAGTGFLTAGVHPAAMAYIAETTHEERRTAGMALMASAYGIGSFIGPVLSSILSPYSMLLPVYLSAAVALVGAILGVYTLNNVRTTQSSRVKNNIRLTDRRVLPILFGIAFVYFAFSAFQQTIAFYIQDLFNLTPKVAASKTGITVALMAITMIVVQLGLLQFFKFNVSFLLLTGTVFSCIGFTTLLIIKDMYFINISSALVGAGFGMIIPAIQTSASLAVSDKEQGSVSGFIFSASAFGYVIGPLLGTFLFSQHPSSVFIFGIVSVVIAAILLLRKI